MTPATHSTGKTVSTRAMLDSFARGLKSFEKTEFALDPREVFEGDICDVHAVYKGDDIIFQLFPKRRARVLTRDLVAEAVDVWFGSTERFSGSYIPELESWALRARGLAALPSYDREHHVVGFATYLNEALAAL